MNRAVLIRVPVDQDGKPDLQLPPGGFEGTTLVREGRFWHASWNGYSLSATRIGTFNGDPIFVGTGDRRILVGLAHLGAGVMLLLNAWQDPAIRTWLMARGIQEVNGKPVAPHVFAGDTPIAIGADNVVVEG